MKRTLTKRPSIVVVGSMNLDISAKVEHLPQPGETVLGSDLSHSPGGKGSNQAAAAALAGASVTLVAAVGVDAYGKQLITSAAELGIDTGNIFYNSASKTGTALIWVDFAGENSIVVSPGANAALTKEYVERQIANIAKFDLVSACLEIEQDVVLGAFEVAKDRGAITLLNASPLTAISPRLLQKTDYLVVNEVEFLQLTGVNYRDAESAIRSLETLGPSCFIVTLGSEGAMAMLLDGGSAKIEHFPTVKVEVVDTTGCGDCFAGSVATEIAAGHNLFDAIPFALRAASYAARSNGAQASYGSRSEVLSH